MSKIIGGVEYYIPANLTDEQEQIYCHIIDWKRKNITEARGLYKGREYDAILPEEFSARDYPIMLYRPILEELRVMQSGKFAYKIHKFAHHIVSSQTACVNLFMPLLLSNNVDAVLPLIPGCPKDFKQVARDRLYQGFCFEYWGQDIKGGKGLLDDHSPQAGTDADVAIAYYNTDDELCLWMIEHKLSEKEFTECGAYRSRRDKQACLDCSLADIRSNPQICHYHHQKGYRYWDELLSRKDKFNGDTAFEGCPFRCGMNQLWRNQVLGFALEDSGAYHRVTFSVCHHGENTMLNQSINQYKSLIDNDMMFSSFTNYDVLDVVSSEHEELAEWKRWYEEVYRL